ncbi:hypothetical protein ABPG73_006403 [Tetrahymena malaccensis]
MVQGKKQAFNFMNEKHKPLVYDDNFKSFKYSQQLQKIIDGLTKFIPKERLSIKEAFEQLKEIISVEFNLDQKFQTLVSEQTQKSSQNELNEIEFVEAFNKLYYPIVDEEQIQLSYMSDSALPIRNKLQVNIVIVSLHNYLFRDILLFQYFCIKINQTDSIFLSQLIQKNSPTLGFEPRIEDLKASVIPSSKKQSVFKLGDPKFRIKCLNVRNLKLDFSLCEITSLHSISLALLSFKNLQVLDLNLSANSIQDKHIPLLSSSLLKCEKLQSLKLDLQLNEFDDIVYSSLGQALAKCTLLSTLILDLRRLSNRNAYKIAYALDNKKDLQTLVLRLDQNKIGSDGVNFLFSQLAKCATNLENFTLSLSFIMMEDQVASSFSIFLQKLTNLKQLDLDLSCNNLNEGNSISSLSSALIKFSHLTSLNLNLKYLNLRSGKALTDLGNSIAQCVSLQNLEIDLEETYIKGYNVSKFIQTLVKCVNLLSLKISIMKCNTKDKFTIEIADALAKLSNLQNLNLILQSNSFGNIGVANLAQALAQCHNLQHLDLILGENDFDIDDNTFLRGVRKMKRLVKYNYLSQY